MFAYLAEPRRDKGQHRHLLSFVVGGVDWCGCILSLLI